MQFLSTNISLLLRKYYYLKIQSKLSEGFIEKRLLGFSLLFISVGVITLALVIYLGGWAASTSYQYRVDTYQPAKLVDSSTLSFADDIPVEHQAWDEVALLLCLLH